MPKLQGEGWDEWIFRQSVEVGLQRLCAFTRAFLLISFIAGVIDTAITDLSNGCANHSLDAVRYGVMWWRAKWKVGTRNAAHPMLWTNGDQGGTYVGGVRVEAADSGVKSAGCSNRKTSLNAFLYISREELHMQ